MKELEIPIAVHQIVKSAIAPSHCIQVVRQAAGLANPVRKYKRWGWELIYTNSRGYCMKMLYIKSGYESSMHFHVNKHETLLVTQGELLLAYKNSAGEIQEIIVPENHAWVIPPGFQHQLTACHGDVYIVEASTYDDSHDSVRVHM